MLLIQLVEYNNLINSVEEFRLEHPFYFLHNPILHEFIPFSRIIVGCKAQPFRRHNIFCPCIGCHNNYRIFKINLSALGIRNVSIIQNLKKNVKHIRMRLLHLIKQDNRIRIAANLFAELSALLIAHISWGRTNHLGDAVLLHVL